MLLGIIQLALCIVLTRPLVNGQTIDRKRCVLECKLPNFLKNICDPVKPYLKCGKKLQSDINNFRSMGEITTACSCIWYDVFKRGRVDKLLFMEIVDYKAADKKVAVRTRVATLSRLCRNLNDQLCGEFVSGYKPNKTIGHGKIFSSKAGWNMAPLRKAQLMNLTKKMTTTDIPHNHTSSLVPTAVGQTSTSKSPIKLTTLKTTAADPKTGNSTTKPATVNPQVSPGMSNTTTLFGLNQSEQVILGIVVASVAVVLIVCMFFIMKLRKEIQPGFGDGSLLQGPDTSHNQHGRRSSSYDKFMDKLRTNSKISPSERERLLDHENSSFPSSEKKKEKKKKRSKHSTGPGTNCQGTQCDVVDFDVSMTTFSASEEVIQAKTLSGMPISDSESDGDESRVFHSTLMHGKREPGRSGINAIGLSSTSLVSN